MGQFFTNSQYITASNNKIVSVKLSRRAAFTPFHTNGAAAIVDHNVKASVSTPMAELVGFLPCKLEKVSKPISVIGGFNSIGNKPRQVKVAQASVSTPMAELVGFLPCKLEKVSKPISAIGGFIAINKKIADKHDFNNQPLKTEFLDLTEITDRMLRRSQIRQVERRIIRYDDGAFMVEPYHRPKAKASLQSKNESSKIVRKQR